MRLPQLLASRLEPLTENQLDSICALQRSSQQAEDALSREMEALRQSIVETVAASGSSSSRRPAGSSGDSTSQMAAAVAKLGALEILLRQVNLLCRPWLYCKLIVCFRIQMQGFAELLCRPMICGCGFFRKCSGYSPPVSAHELCLRSATTSPGSGL
jgi:hypothetical protein